MKKMMSMLMIVVLVLGLSGCGEEASDSTGDASKEAGEIANDSNGGTSGAEESQTVDTKSDASEPEEKEKEEEVLVEEVATEEEVDEPLVLDAELSNLELLATVPYKAPDKVMTVTESLAADGTTSTSIMYQDGFNMRTETVSEDVGTQIMIYNAEEGVMYSYNVEAGSGIMSLDSEDDSDFSMGMDMSMDNSMEVMPEGDYSMADVFVDPAMGDFEASVEDLKDMQVIHLVIYSDDGMGGTMDIHSWYSVEYGIVMKTEMYMGGALLGSSEVIDYDLDPDMDDSMFEKPEGITFMQW